MTWTYSTPEKQIMDAERSSFCDVPLITIHGDIDHDTVRGLTPLMLEGLALPGARLVFDLTDCPYLDSSGIGLFLGLLFEVAETGWLGVVGANEPLTRVFDLTGLSSRRNFHTWTDLEALRLLLNDEATGPSPLPEYREADHTR
jgi:anti-anti-sigma factor